MAALFFRSRSDLSGQERDIKKGRRLEPCESSTRAVGEEAGKKRARVKRGTAERTSLKEGKAPIRTADETKQKLDFLTCEGPDNAERGISSPL